MINRIQIQRTNTILLEPQDITLLHLHHRKIKIKYLIDGIENGEQGE